MRPVLLATSAPPSAVTKGKSLRGQRVTSAAGNLSAGVNAGLVAGCGCTAHRAARPAQGLLDLILLLLAEPGLELSVPASAGTPRCPVRRRGVIDWRKSS